MTALLASYAGLAVRDRLPAAGPAPVAVSFDYGPYAGGALTFALVLLAVPIAFFLLLGLYRLLGRRQARGRETWPDGGEGSWAGGDGAGEGGGG